MFTIRKLREALKLSSLTTRQFVHEPTGSRAVVYHSGNTATVSGVETPIEHRGKGGAHEVMKMVTKHLDDNKIDARLHPQPYGDKAPSKRVLVNFYKKHGFKKVKGFERMERKYK